MFLSKKIPNKYVVELINNTLDLENIEEIILELDKFKLSPYLYRYMKNKNLIISHNLKKIYQRNAISNIIILDYKEYLEKKLKKKQIRYLFYKGVYLIENIYKSIGDRYLGDIDLLVHPHDLDKLKEIFKDEKTKINQLIQDNFFQEIYILTKYKGQDINIDIHKNFFPIGKYPINLDIFFKNNKIEHHLLIIIMEINSEYLSDEKRILDLVLIIENNKIDWEYFYSLVSNFKLNKAVFVTLNFINTYFNKNYPLKNINSIDKILLKHTITFNNKRWNQLFLFFYNFDNFNDYRNFFIKKIKYAYKNKSLYKEFRKFWIEYH